MIERYTKPEMGKIWTEEHEFRRMLDVEIYACEAQAELGVIPKEAVKTIREKADFKVERIHEIEAEINHDIISFLTAVGEFVGEDSKYIHMGLTSTDVKDTALCSMLCDATDLLIKDLEAFHEVLRRRAVEFKYTEMVGRTHGIHAEPTTFGLKLLLWYDETERNLRRLRTAREEIAVGKISGAVGTYANVDPFVEKYVCEKLGLTPSTSRRSPSSPAPWINSPPKSVTCSARIFVKRKNISRRNKKVRRPCRTNVTRLPANASAVSRASCAVTVFRRSKTWRCGMNAISRTPRSNASSWPTRRSPWITCCRFSRASSINCSFIRTPCAPT